MCRTIAGDNELVITTYVAGLQYQDYIPLYIYFALLAYPDAFVAVYLQDSLHPDIGLKLDVIPSDRWCVHQTYKTKLSQSGHASLMRAFLNAEFLQQFKYQYVGDVDVFILRETPSLVKQHVQHMQMIGEPYSNVDRYVMGMPDKIDKGHKCRAADCHRVTGLHFFETKPYMARIKHAQAKWEGFLAQMGGKKMCSSILNVRKLAWCDETLLYRIITDSGMSVPTRQQWFRPHHGVHIRIYSKGRKAVPEYARQLEAVLHNHLEALVPYIYDHGNQSELALCISTFLQKENYDLYSEYRVYAQSKYKINISPTYIYRNEAVQVAAKRSRPKTNIPRKVRNRSLMKTSQRLEPRLYITST
ncbi:hypothetical protein SARC_01573 [Sphaeroforma arctica JP610]|uniref:Uncharacterized protein n=1 Tax=Sphaeroforma arctica JP610 TaxID=667725 RepID=A0A0L0GBH9_9EUKA|nr:hypothetical protein SARC_01573 [Sphaeroforma arctica JP610]KNC86251.1 hypothetical protein SARC_01573 [Sphaeroforma arctica JP610]|eukprot:XP_014160153.1 hypothetical protein SARC_01573 [Sphaeroforma arctica JP610]